MKKYLIILAAAAVFVSCGKETIEPEKEIATVQETPVTFNLTANHPDPTKAVKSGWEAGDAIFVFFTGAAAPKHLKMTYDGSTWTSAEYDGATQTDGALGLSNGDTGTMRAVFLPFCSEATVSASGTDFIFSTTYYAYYLTATLSYTVTDNEVSGAFNMTIPDDYVQFFIEDSEATDGAYTLGTDAVIPTGVASIAANGDITETSDKAAGDDMTGYVYGSGAAKGHLFSGKLNGSYSFGGYYFAKTKTADNSRADYFVTGKTLASHSAVKLPAQNNERWSPVGENVTVNMGSDIGIWFTCNYGCSVPEQIGTLYSFQDANALGVDLPSKELFEKINNASYCSYTWLEIHSQPGVVFKSEQGFLFLPTTRSDVGEYWSSTEHSDSQAWYCNFIKDFAHGVGRTYRTDEYAVRPFQN